MKPQSMFEQQEIKCQYIYFQLASCCSLLARENDLFWKFLASLASWFFFLQKTLCQGDIPHSPVPMAELLPKWGCQGMKEHSSTEGASESADSTPKYQRKFCQFQNFPLKKIKTKLFVRQHMCIWVSSWRTTLSWKIVLFLRKLLFLQGRSLSESSIHSKIMPPLFLPHLRGSSLWKSLPFLQKCMKYSLKFGVEIKSNLYSRFDHMPILLLFSEADIGLS